MKLRRFMLLPAGAALVVASWFGASALRDESPAAAVDGSLGRIQLIVCVDVDPGAGQERRQLLAQVEASMARLEQGERWREAGLDAYPWRVQAGCPGGYVAPPENAGPYSSQVVGGRVEVPSSVSTMVYLVGPGSRHELGERQFARAAREMLCDEEGCMEVTTAVFVTPELAADEAALDRAMRFGLGIDGPEDATYPQGHPPGENQTKP